MTLADLTLPDRRASLQAFRRALDREAHVFATRPDLLWQQLFNRLQWEGEPITSLLAPNLKQRLAPGTRPWVRMKTPFCESGALIRDLVGNTDSVFACAISPDGSFIVSSSRDKTLRIWDSQTGRERARLGGHTDEVWSCKVS